MPIPLLLLWGLGALAAGGAAAGGAKLAGDAARDDAETIARNAANYVAARRQEFVEAREALLNRLTTFSTMLEAVCGGRPIARIEKAPLPPELQAIWDFMSSTSFNRSIFDQTANTWKFTPDEVTFARGAYAANYSHPGAGGIMYGALLAKKGVDYASANFKHKSQIEAICNQRKAAADKQVSSIRKLRDVLERDFDAIVAGTLNDALQGDRDKAAPAVATLHQFSLDVRKKAEELLG